MLAISTWPRRTWATAFRAIGGPSGARVFHWSPRSGVGGSVVSLTTASDTARLPDPSVLGLGFAPGGSYDWRVTTIAAGDLETAASLDSQTLLTFVYVGPIGVPDAGAIAVSETRKVTLAP